MFHDPTSGATFTPLAALPQAKASFEVHNSPLTENAVLGYEFGYNVTAGHLVVWEAQYGDFINGAQVIIDEFLVSARAKWEQTPSLVLLLPHGHEGQGPDHSSGRPERFLQLAAEYNLRLANCTTAAQYFHLLRRQAALLKSDPLPLVILTPKSLLRHPQVASAPQALASGGWQPVLDDPRAPRAARRLVLCSGKIYVDLITSDGYTQAADKLGDLPAIVRLEQVYPFPADDLRQVIDSYPDAREFFWVQEEPQNMGAWDFVQPRIAALLPESAELRCIARPPSGSPAEGSAAWHQANQQEIINQALGGG